MTDHASERTPIVQRFPELADLDSKDESSKLKAFNDALSALQHELDATRQ
ncbi:hypothetical protein JS530_05130 [Bifidobacterium sp. LC6]|uniref:Uncharacterized protein n=1 Tax=Bifidobacterium colobi TaxID=2809026 RepID=A0ABS5UWA6_9BIFI|nr:hypothetical protein [Bifidobacterium colobi]MBT1174889.1 hypothetical protein [Bifidobacterium colobi]